MASKNDDDDDKLHDDNITVEYFFVCETNFIGIFFCF